MDPALNLRQVRREVQPVHNQFEAEECNDTKLKEERAKVKFELEKVKCECKKSTNEITLLKEDVFLLQNAIQNKSKTSNNDEDADENNRKKILNTLKCMATTIYKK